MVLTLTFCFLASSWRAFRADSSNLNEAVAVFGLKLCSATVGICHVISLPNVSSGTLERSPYPIASERKKYLVSICKRVLIDLSDQTMETSQQSRSPLTPAKSAGRMRDYLRRIRSRLHR